MIFIDTDILLDIALKRVPFWVDAATLLNKVAKGEVRAGTTPLVMANCFYIIHRQAGQKTAGEFLELALQLLEEIPLTFHHQRKALASSFSDKEDGFNYFACLSTQVTEIVTRNKRDFTAGKIPVFAPREYLLHIDQR